MHRISLSNETHEGKNNAYLFAEGPKTVLVDTGGATTTAREDLEIALEAADTTIDAIDEVYLTHWHPDHTGLTAEIQTVSDATVYAHEADADLAAGIYDTHVSFWEEQVAALDRWGVPDEQVAEVLDTLSEPNRTDETADIDRFSGGETVIMDGHSVEIVTAPGHSAGSACFVWTTEGKREAIVGDALLPEYTPNVGGSDVRVNEPLRKYLDTLLQFVHGEYSRAWPGHRYPINEPTERAQEIVRHHEERAMRVVRTLRQYESATPWELSIDMFGDLKGVHILQGPGEVFAHLDHLNEHGVVERTDTEYTLVDDTLNRFRSPSGNDDRLQLIKRAANGEWLAVR